MSKFQAAIEELGFKFVIKEVLGNPLLDDESWAAKHYQFTLSTDLGFHTSFYSVGQGVIEQEVVKQFGTPGNECGPFKQGTVAWHEWVNRKAKDYLPQISDVLSCLLSDSCGADGSFEDWASNYGYESDSRRAYRIWEACRETRQALVRLIGEEGLDSLIDLAAEEGEL